jgi:hypothetical protein
MLSKWRAGTVNTRAPHTGKVWFPMFTHPSTLSVICEGGKFGMCDDDGCMLLNWQQTTDPAVVIARANAPHIVNVDCDDETLAILAEIPALHRKLWRYHSASEFEVGEN